MRKDQKGEHYIVGMYNVFFKQIFTNKKILFFSSVIGYFSGFLKEKVSNVHISRNMSRIMKNQASGVGRHMYNEFGLIIYSPFIWYIGNPNRHDCYQLLDFN